MANTESNAQSLNSTSGSSGADLGDRTANNLAPGPKQTGDYTDKNAISGRIDFFMAKDRYTRWIFEREWFRNVLYYLGRQWIIYDVTNRRWRPKTLPIWFPQPYTNKFAEKANDVTSAYVQGRVPISYSPASDDPDALATATIAEDFRESFYAETEIEDREETLAKWVTLTGNAFLHTYYDYSPEYGTKLIQDQQCADCGQTAPPADIVANGMKCPQCGSSNLQPAVDENGQPQGQEMPKGRMKADICSAFEMRVDPTIEEFTLQRRATRVRTYDIMFAREYWGGRAGPDGKPIDAKEIVADKEGSIGQFYLDALSYMTASFGAGGGFIAGGGNAFKLPRVSAYEYYELPSDDFPEGIHAVRLGHSANLVVVAEPLDSTYGAGEYAGQKFLPFVHFRGDKVPGRLWAKTRMDDLIPLQNFRNLVESALKLTAQRTGNPLWLNPKGSGVANMTGEPGQWVDYNPVTLGGTSFAKPERVPADLSNVQGFTVLLNKIDDAIERVTGTFFAGGGETPPGVTAASALAYLGERAQQSISPMKREWAKGWKRWEMQALEIARANWDDERIVALAGANRHWEVKKFMSADLQGAVKMDVDYQGLFRKSQASKRADIQLLTQLGVLNPQNPEEQWNMLEAFGETKLLGSMDLDIRVATIEFQEFSDYGTPPQLIPMIQNSAAHILQHKKDANSDKFKALPLPMQTAWYQHIREHILDLAMSQQPLIPPGAGQGAPPQGAPGNQPQAGPGGNHATKVPQGAAAKEPKEPGPVAKGKNRAQAEMGNRNSGQNGMAPAAAGGSFAQ